MKLGMIGLGVMGRNLALNARDRGLEVVATDSWASARQWAAPGIAVAGDAAALASALPAPRTVLVMVKAGDQVDREIAGLAPHLGPGDVVVDGGNSHYRDTERRARELEGRGIGYLGLGVSGGAEGARHGAALMAGGSAAAWATARRVLRPLAAEAGDGVPTLARFGDGGAGHFVKMVHNGIEYAIMQALAECHGLLAGIGGCGPEAIAAILGDWNARGRAAGFLLEITAEIATARDPLAEGYLLAQVSDMAGQKGTGAWTVQAGLDYGVPLPSIMEALCARQISGQREARAAVRAAVPAASHRDAPGNFVADLETALVATMIVALCQGLHLYAAAARAHGWVPDLPDVLRVWRAGSILRMGLLDSLAGRIAGAGTADPLAAASIAADVAASLPAWRRIAGAAVAAGFPAPVLAGSLTYVEALGTGTLPTAMVQAQRDRFGAHGFGRTDRAGEHHGPWVHPDQEAQT